MPIPDATYSTLANIQTKVRRLTRTPSQNQMTDAELNNYINTFVLYDFPEHLRMFSLRTNLTFYCQPYIDIYTTNTTNPDDPLYNFSQKYISIHEPVFIAGYQVFYSQSQEQFNGIYPIISNIASIGVAGDGLTANFAGMLSQSAIPIMQNRVLFSSVDINNNGIALVDEPQSASIGNLYDSNDIPTGPLRGRINYITGAYTLNFDPTTPPGVNAAINSQTVPYVPNRPQALMFYQNTFTLRPIPDQPYRIDMETYIRPAELLATNQMPELSEWWQYIAYGASKKVFEDRMDMDSVNMIMPEFKRQESLILRRAIVQQTNERVATIYTEQTNGPTSGGFGWGAGGLI